MPGCRPTLTMLVRSNAQKDVSIGKETFVITSMSALYLSHVCIYYNVLVTYLCAF